MIELRRQTIIEAWKKFQKHLPLSLIEQEIVNVINLHPELQAFFANESQYVNLEFSPTENPFLHISLHMTIQEQLRTDKPTGIKKIYEELMIKVCDQHLVLHLLMDGLQQTLWEAQQKNQMPNEQDYLERLRGK